MWTVLKLFISVTVATCWNYQDFLSALGDLLSFSVPGGGGGFWVVVCYRGSVPRLIFWKFTFIGPFSFSTSLLTKLPHALDRCTYPSSSVTTLKKFLWSSSQDENKCFENGNVKVWADKWEKERSPESRRMGQHLSA